MKFLSFFSAMVLTLTISSCDIINPPEQIPSYIYIPDVALVDNPFIAEGSLDENITALQVFVGGNYLGIFSLPATIPVLDEGSLEVILDPMVKENGQTFFLNVYPHYQRYDGTLELEAAQTDTLIPEFSYIDDLEIGFIEDFEVGATIFTNDRDGNEDTFMDVSTDVVFEGDRSGLIRLDSTNFFIDVGTEENSLFSLLETTSVWLEMNVRSDIDVILGLVGYDGGSSIASQFEYGVVGGDGWRKLYFNLRPLVLNSGFDEYAIAITTGIPLENGQFVFNETKSYFDNIKLLYR